MHKVCENKDSEVLKVLLEAKLVNQHMLKIGDGYVSEGNVLCNMRVEALVFRNEL